MKSLIVVLVLQIFIGHSISDVIDDNRETAMNAIKECIDESKVKPKDLKSALETKDYDQDEVENFNSCYDDRMEDIKDLVDHCGGQEEKDAMSHRFVSCFYTILDEYAKEYLK